MSRVPGFRGLRFYDRTDGRGDVLLVESPVATPGAVAFFAVNDDDGVYLTRVQVHRLRQQLDVLLMTVDDGGSWRHPDGWEEYDD